MTEIKKDSVVSDITGKAEIAIEMPSEYAEEFSNFLKSNGVDCKPPAAIFQDSAGFTDVYKKVTRPVLSGKVMFSVEMTVTDNEKLMKEWTIKIKNR
jgi:hypothetical protein